MSTSANDPEWGPTREIPALSPRPVSPAALLRTARPRQWLKNLLVFAAPGAAGSLLHADVMGRAVAAFALFCLISSGTYFLNDAADFDADRRHPLKRDRPVAAGLIPVRQAWGIGLMAVGSAVGLGLLLGPRTCLVLALYALFTISYSLGLKREPVLEMGVLTGGFILRAVAGGVATRVPLSDWFLIVASFGSLFMVGGKRYAEFEELGPQRDAHRAVLAGYTAAYLRYVRSVSSSVAMAGYCLWAFEKARPAGHATAGSIWFQLSIAPFVLAILRYALVLDAGGGGAPEDVVLSDRALQLLAVAWLFCFALGVYGL